MHSNHSKHKLPKSVKGFYLLSLLACPWLWTFYQLVGFIHKCLFMVGEKPLEGKFLSIPVPFSLSFLWMSTALPLLDLKVLYWYRKSLEGSQGSNSKEKLAPETVTWTLSFATLQHLNYLEGVIRKTHKWPVPPTSVPPYEKKKICSYHRYCDYWSLLTDVTSLEMAALWAVCSESTLLISGTSRKQKYLKNRPRIGTAISSSNYLNNFQLGKWTRWMPTGRPRHVLKWQK